MELRLCIIVATLLAVGFAVPVKEWDASSPVSKCSLTCSTPKNLIYEIGKTYVYEYNSKTRLQLKDNDGTQAKISAKVHIAVHSPCEFSLQLKETRVEGVEDASKMAADLERHPLMFAYDDGLIANVCPAQEDESYLVNIKKGILSVLQISTPSLENGEQIISERDIYGNCETTYNVKSTRHSVKVIKSKDSKTCSNTGRTTWSAFYPRRYSTMDSSINSLPILSQNNNCEIEVTGKLIKNVACNLQSKALPLSWSSNDASIDIETIVKHIETRDEITEKPLTKFTRHSLAYKSSPRTVKSDEKYVVSLLTKMCENIRDEITAQTPKQFAELVYSLRPLQYAEIKRIYQRVQTGKICSPVGKLADIFTDAMIMDSSEGSLKMIVEMIKNRETTPARANYWLTLLSFASHPTERAVEALMPLIAEDAPKQALLGVSSYIRNYCEQDSTRCHKNAVIDKVVVRFMERLREIAAKQQNQVNEEEFVVALRAVANLGNLISTSHLVQYVRPFYTSRQYSSAIRVAAIEALERQTCQPEVAKDLLKILEDKEESPEVRIAAYRAMIQCPTEEVVKRIENLLQTETSEQVGSYIVSHLLNAQTTSDPHKKHIRQAVAGIRVPQDKFQQDFRRFSRNFELSHLFEKLNFGAVVESDVIYDRSFVPRSVRANVTLPLFGRALNVMEVGVRQKGLEKIIEKIVEQKDWLKSERNMTEVFEVLMKFMKSGKIEELEKSRYTSMLKRAIQSPSELSSWAVEGLKVSTYLKIDGKYIAQMSMNDAVEVTREVRQLLTSYGKSLKSWSTSKGVDRAFSFMLMDVSHEIPTPNGLPIKVDVNATAMFGYKLSDSGFYPSISTEFSALMGFDARNRQPGIKYVQTFHSSPAIKADVEYKNERPVRVTFQMPKEKMQLFSYKSKIVHVNGENQEIEITPKRAVRQHEGCSTSFSKVFGVEVCTKLHLPSPILTAEKPFAPFNGPIEFDLTVQRTDNQMKGWQLTLELPQNDKNEWRFRAGFDTPQSKINRQIGLDAYLRMPENGEKAFKVELQMPGKRIVFEKTIQLTFNKAVAKAELAIDSKIYRAEAGIERESRQSETVLKPWIEIATPTRKPIHLEGKINVIESQAGSNDRQTIKFFLQPKHSESKYLEGTVQRSQNQGKVAFATDIQLKHKLISGRLTSEVDYIRGERKSASTLTKLSYKLWSSESQNEIEIKARVQDLSTSDVRKMVNMVQIKSEQFPLINLQANWNLVHRKGKQIEHEFTLNHGKNTESRHVRFMHSLKLTGYEQVRSDSRLEQTIELEIPAMEVDVQMKTTGHLETSKLPKFAIAASALNKRNGKEMKFNYEYKHLVAEPLKISMDAYVKAGSVEIKYTDRIEQVKPNEYHGKSDLIWGQSKNAHLEYTFKSVGDRHQKHYELDVSFKHHALAQPIRHQGLIKLSNSGVELKSKLNAQGTQIWSFYTVLNVYGRSQVSLETVQFNGQISAQLNGESRHVSLELKDKYNQYHHNSKVQLSKRALTAASSTLVERKQMFKINSHFSRTQPSKVIIETRRGSLKFELDVSKAEVIAGVFDIKCNEHGSYMTTSFSLHPSKLIVKSKSSFNGEYYHADLSLSKDSPSYLKLDSTRFSGKFEADWFTNDKRIVLNAEAKNKQWQTQTEIKAHDNEKFEIKSVTKGERDAKLLTINGQLTFNGRETSFLEIQSPKWTAKANGEWTKVRKSLTIDASDRQNNIKHVSNMELSRREIKINSNTEHRGKQLLYLMSTLNEQQLRFVLDNGNYRTDLNMERISKILFEFSTRYGSKIQHKTELRSEKPGELSIASKTEMKSKNVFVLNGKLNVNGKSTIQVISAPIIIDGEVDEKTNGKITFQLKPLQFVLETEFKRASDDVLTYKTIGKFGNEKIAELTGSFKFNARKQIIAKQSTIKSKWADGVFSYDSKAKADSEVKFDLKAKRFNGQPMKHQVTAMYKKQGETHVIEGKMNGDDESAWKGRFTYDADEMVKIAIEKEVRGRTEGKLNGEFNRDAKKVAIKVESKLWNGKFETDFASSEKRLVLKAQGRSVQHTTEAKYTPGQKFVIKSHTKSENQEIFMLSGEVKRDGKITMNVRSDLVTGILEGDVLDQEKPQLKLKFDVPNYGLKHSTEISYIVRERQFVLRTDTRKNGKIVFVADGQVSPQVLSLRAECHHQQFSAQYKHNDKQVSIKFEDRKRSNKIESEMAFNNVKKAIRGQFNMEGKPIGRFELVVDHQKESRLIVELNKIKLRITSDLNNDIKLLKFNLKTPEHHLKHETDWQIINAKRVNIKSQTHYNEEPMCILKVKLDLENITNVSLTSRLVDVKGSVDNAERTLKVEFVNKLSRKQRRFDIEVQAPWSQTEYGVKFTTKHDKYGDYDRSITMKLLGKRQQHGWQHVLQVHFDKEHHYLLEALTSDESDTYRMNWAFGTPERELFLNIERNQRQLRLKTRFSNDKRVEHELTSTVMTDRKNKAVKGQIAVKSESHPIVNNLKFDFDHKCEWEKMECKTVLKMTNDKERYATVFNTKYLETFDKKVGHLRVDVETSNDSLRKGKFAIEYETERGENVKLAIGGQRNNEPKFGLLIQAGSKLNKKYVEFQLVGGEFVAIKNVHLKYELQNLERMKVLEGEVRFDEKMFTVKGKYVNPSAYDLTMSSNFGQKFDIVLKKMPKQTGEELIVLVKRGGSEYTKVIIGTEWLNNRELSVTLKYTGPTKPVDIKMKIQFPTLDSYTVDGKLCVQSTCYNFDGEFKNQNNIYNVDKLIKWTIKDHQQTKLYALNALWKQKQNQLTSQFVFEVNDQQYGYVFDYNKYNIEGKLLFNKRIAQIKSRLQLENAVEIITVDMWPNFGSQPAEKLTVELRCNGWWHEQRETPLDNIESSIKISSSKIVRPLMFAIKTVDNQEKQSVKMIFDFYGSEENKITFYYDLLKDKFGYAKKFEMKLYNEDKKLIDTGLVGQFDVKGDRHYQGKFNWYWLNRQHEKITGEHTMEINFADHTVRYQCQCPVFGKLELTGKWSKITGKNEIRFNGKLVHNQQTKYIKTTVNYTVNPCFDVEIRDTEDSVKPVSRYHACFNSNSVRMLKFETQQWQSGVDGEKIEDSYLTFDKHNGKVVRLALQWQPTILKRRMIKLAQQIQFGRQTPQMMKLNEEFQPIYSELSSQYNQNIAPVRSWAADNYDEVRRDIMKQSEPLRRNVREIREKLPEMSTIPVWIQNFINDMTKKVAEKMVEFCPQDSVCYELGSAYEQHGWTGVKAELRVIGKQYKAKWQTFENMINDYAEQLPQGVKNVIHKLEKVIDHMLEPIGKNKIVKRAIESIVTLKRETNERFENVREQIYRQVEELKQMIRKNRDLNAIVNVLGEISREIRGELKTTDYSKVKRLITEARHELMKPSALLANSRILVFNPQEGRIEIELQAPIEPQTVRKFYDNVQNRRNVHHEETEYRSTESNRYF